ncbi:MAG: ParA family protein [Desulfovibrio sp.]|nr:MAG: ParA family protein [Desulfovibrio sp.]
MEGKILSVANQKGGVGKTTTALSLGAALAKRGRRVLVLDLDPHASASVHLKVYQEQVTHSIMDVFGDRETEPSEIWRKVRMTPHGQAFDFVPSHTHMTDLETDLKMRQDKGMILKHMLAEVRHEYDYVMIDCPPHMGVLLINALVAADLVIIPIQTDFLAVHGLKLLFETFRTLNRILDQPIAYRVLATMFDARAGACRRVLNLLRKKMETKIFETVINMDTKFREASAQGAIISDLYPNSRGAHQYNLLANELESLW